MDTSGIPNPLSHNRNSISLFFKLGGRPLREGHAQAPPAVVAKAATSERSALDLSATLKAGRSGKRPLGRTAPALPGVLPDWRF